MTPVQSAVLLFFVGLGLLGLMWFGWRKRARRTQELVSPLPAVPADGLGEQLFETLGGIYVSSTVHGDWLERIAAQDLGFRSAANLGVYSGGVLIERSGAKDIFIPTDHLIGASEAPGIAGKVMGPSALVLIQWRIASQEDGETQLDSGFKPDHRSQQSALIAAINALVQAGQDPTKENQ